MGVRIRHRSLSRRVELMIFVGVSLLKLRLPSGASISRFEENIVALYYRTLRSNAIGMLESIRI
jgi:hypothetical protein